MTDVTSLRLLAFLAASLTATASPPDGAPHGPMQGAAAESQRRAMALVRRGLESSAGTLATAASLEVRERTIGHSFHEQLTFGGHGETTSSEDGAGVWRGTGTFVRDNWFEAPGRFFD